MDTNAILMDIWTQVNRAHLALCEGYDAEDYLDADELEAVLREKSRVARQALGRASVILTYAMQGKEVPR